MAMRILLVEDDKMVLDVSKAMLEHLGYQVLTAQNAHEAIELISRQKEEIGLILMDYRLPDMCGRECLKEIRKTSSVPAILMPGFGDELSVGDGNDALFQGTLSKPFHLEAMQQAIHNVLGRPSQEDAIT